MTEREEAVLHFQWLKKRLCEEWQKFIPKDSIAYKASEKEAHYYDMAISALSAEGEYIKKEDALAELDKWDWQELYLPIHFKENILDELPTYSFPDREKGEWIPVSERLPEMGVRVLCACQADLYDVLKLTPDGWFYDTRHTYMFGFVLAWQPLPEPYEI